MNELHKTKPHKAGMRFPHIGGHRNSWYRIPANRGTNNRMNGVRAADREELFISRLFEWGLCSEFSGHIAHEIRFDTTGLTGILNEAEFPFAIEVADFDDFQFSVGYFR